MATKGYFDLVSRHTPLCLRVYAEHSKDGRVTLVHTCSGTAKPRSGKRESSHSLHMRVASSRWYGAWLTLRRLP